MPFLVGSRAPSLARSRTAMDPKIPSSISRLFHTNSVPSPMDAQEINELLAERNQELSVVSKEIERARAEVQRLENKHAEVQGVVHELEALMSPVRRMPTDIMAKIFEHAVRDQDMPKPDPRLAPLLLGQICHSWRSLLFSLPCLWTTLQVDFPSGAKEWERIMQSKIMSMHVWLSRSKAVPISVFLNHPRGSQIQWAALMLLDKEILTLGARLKELTLHFSPQALSTLLTFTQSPLPYLEHLELQNSNSLPANDNPPALILHSAPNLRRLSVSWCSLDLREFQVPWNQLLELNLQYDASSFWNPVHSDYLQILSQCPNLTTCFLGVGATIEDVDPETIQPVTLTNVHTFKVSVYVQTAYLRHFFDALRLPKLRSFEIKNVSLALGSFTGETECLPFLERCADTLEAISFSRMDVSDPAILSCIAQLHHLKTMFFLPGVLRLNHSLLTALTYGSPSTDGASDFQRICPSLETLQLRCSSAVPVDAVAGLVQSRCQSEPKLKRFALQFSTFEYGLDTRDEKIRELRARLQVYVEQGLQLYLTKSGLSG
ncbi:hypothetical protein HYDPIDRAFT_112355 [Hydnomerulius pinastri MD-312]|uniref:F-box domain-containing protein n=1 Tax=Hydnomerulius pinastri MD-312 TaxID=994086 RepID=A0A0C9W9F0_9AGAM|nr:hypothetical protein HYDPIDRAFT_112355 [Hydnomerulius pinastri MD-312]